MFTNLLEKINALNYIDNNTSLYMILGMIWLIIIAIIISFIKDMKTIKDALFSLLMSAIILFFGLFVTTLNVEHDLKEKIDKKVEEICYTPVKGIKSILTEDEIKNMTYNELYDKSLAYYFSNHKLLSNYIFNNSKNKIEAKPTKEMNIAYTQAIEDLKLIKNELDDRRKQCLTKVCNDAYYPKSLYQSKEKHMDIFRNLQKYNCSNKEINNGNN